MWRGTSRDQKKKLKENENILNETRAQLHQATVLEKDPRLEKEKELLEKEKERLEKEKERLEKKEELLKKPFATFPRVRLLHISPATWRRICILGKKSDWSSSNKQQVSLTLMSSFSISFVGL